MQRLIGPLVAAFVLAILSFVPAQAQLKQAGQSQIVTFNPNTTPAERRALAEKSGATVLRELPFVDGLEVEFRGMAPMQAVRLKAEPTVESVEPNEYHKWIQAGPALQAPLPSVGAALRSEAPVPALGAGIQVAAEGSAGKAPWGIQRVHAPQVWSRATGAGVKVAVIDTGIDKTHPDLAANYAGGYNAVEPGAEPMDDHGHGTHVAGTIAGSGNEGKGALGVAPRARLYAVKVLNKEGGGTNAVIVDGIAWAVQNGMKVINMSLGGPSSTVLKKAIQKAYAAGVTIVAASGNDPEAPVSAPASYPESIAVSASTSKDGIADFSTTGPEVDFIAPGHEIVSTWPGGKYAKLSGTSMASPHVAGLAALAVSLGASTPDKVRALLTKGAAPLEGLDKNQQGSGFIEADRW
ncbi:hypothetical protein EPO15_08930 [bacterium]|nr:MAG: hypothetical protein EPO15_08930 [bacterium]